MKTVRAFLFSVMCLAPALPLLGDVPDWENEEVTGINKEAPRASVFPASDKTLSLNGDWKFKISMTPDERPADFLQSLLFRFRMGYGQGSFQLAALRLWNGHLHECSLSIQAESSQGNGGTAQELAGVQGA